MRSPTSSLKWEQKLVSQTFKTLLVNTFYAWQMMTKRSLLDTKEGFQSLNHFRARLNAVQSLSEFILDSAQELLVYAGELRMATESPARTIQGDRQQEGQGQVQVTVAEANSLRRLAELRKRNRLPLFNHGDGALLPLSISGHHQQQTSTDKYCALCGMHTVGWRGRRTTFMCSLCNVNVCVCVYAGLRRSC